jgi:hypothetical protein
MNKKTVEPQSDVTTGAEPKDGRLRLEVRRLRDLKAGGICTPGSGCITTGCGAGRSNGNPTQK